MSDDLIERLETVLSRAEHVESRSAEVLVGDLRLTIDRLRDQAREVGWRPTHRHVARGTEYEYLGWGRAQCSPSGLLDDEHVAIYRGKNGDLWARRLAEFNDGRFEPIPAPPAQEPKDEG